MPMIMPYRCCNCGHEFSTEVLSKDEAQRLRDRNEYVGPVLCPKCHRADLIKLKAA